MRRASFALIVIVHLLIVAAPVYAENLAEFSKDKLSLSLSESNGVLQLALKRDDNKALSGKAFALENPNRIVLDIRGLTGPLNKTLSVNSAGVQAIRVGSHPDKVRVVIDLSSKLPDYSLSKEPTSKGIILRFGSSVSGTQKVVSQPTEVAASNIPVVKKVLPSKELRPILPVKKQKVKKKRKAKAIEQHSAKTYHLKGDEIKVSSKKVLPAYTRLSTAKQSSSNPGEEAMIEALAKQQFEQQFELGARRALIGEGTDAIDSLDPDTIEPSDSAKAEPLTGFSTVRDVDQIFAEESEKLRERQREEAEALQREVDRAREANRLLVEAKVAEHLQAERKQVKKLASFFALLVIAVIVFLKRNSVKRLFTGKSEDPDYDPDYSDSKQSSNEKQQLNGNGPTMATSLKTLGLHEAASADEIKSRYKHLAKIFHSDKLASQDLPEEVRELTNEQFKKVSAAYEYLRKQKGF